MAYLWETHLSRASGVFDPMYHQKPRSEIIPFITWTPQNILDIGCGAGATGKLMKEKFPACRIYGVELTPEAAGVAAQTYDQVIIGNVESEEWKASDIPFERIDTVLLLDVLEHLYNPWQFLAELKKRLPDDCRLVASIPNAFNIQLLDELASGHWKYAPWGLLDITHIRFFTEAEMIQLFHDTGFSVSHIGDIPHPESMLPHVVEHTDHLVATSNVTVKNLDAKTSDDLLVIQKVLIVENRLAEPNETPVPSPEIGHRSSPLGPANLRAAPTALASLRNAYLELIRKCILGLIYDDPTLIPKQGIGIFSAASRENGRDWPSVAHSMIGNKRMLNLQQMAEHVVKHNIPGDFIETGVWRGGACIMMRAVLNAYDIRDRTVWVADSFEGLPRPDADRYPADLGDDHFIYEELAIPLTQVQENFSKYGLLDNQVRFLKGWFRDTLPDAPVSRLALMRLDGDMYESTMDALVNLFPKLSRGGIVIVDDYGYIKSCQQAVEDYRTANGITDPIHDIDGFGVYWENLLPNRFSTSADDARPIDDPTSYSKPLVKAPPAKTTANSGQPPVGQNAIRSPTVLNPRLLSEQQKYNRAIKLIEKGALIEGADILIGLAQEDTDLADVYHELGMLALTQSDRLAAAELFSTAIAKSPHPSPSIVELARVQKDDGHFEQALETLSPYLRASGNDGNALALVREILTASTELSAIAWARLVADLRFHGKPESSKQ